MVELLKRFLLFNFYRTDIFTHFKDNKQRNEYVDEKQIKFYYFIYNYEIPVKDSCLCKYLLTTISNR